MGKSKMAIQSDKSEGRQLRLSNEGWKKAENVKLPKIAFGQFITQWPQSTVIFFDLQIKIENKRYRSKAKEKHIASQ